MANEPNPRRSRPSLSLVIGSGGAKCVAALGVSRVLQQEKIPIDLFVGTSGGSIYAACLAMGMEPDEIIERTLVMWTGGLMEGYTSNLRAVLSGEKRFDERSGLIDEAPTNAALTQVFGDTTFSAISKPLYIAATDMANGSPVVFPDDGPAGMKVFDAVRASISIPIVYPPWKVGERWLVDGAVSDPLPVDLAMREGADIILAIGFELPLRAHLRTYTAVTSHFNNLYMNNLLRGMFAFHNLAHHAEIILVLPEFERAMGTFDRDLMPYAVQKGEEAMRSQLDYLRRLLDSRSGEA